MRPREAEVEDLHKRPAMEVASASKTPVVGLDVQIVDSPVLDSALAIPQMSPLDAAISSIRTALGFGSSMH